jgi:uncharacterized repeat protein (TIGR01451 family)
MYKMKFTSKLFFYSVLLSLFLSPPLIARAATTYVDADATGIGDGTTWENAYLELQSALAAVTGGDQIWVAEGVYYPDEGTGQIDNERPSTFILIDNVALYGGFDPGSGVDEMGERDWETYITVLSGDIDGDDTTDPNGVVIDTADTTGSNAFHVVTSNGLTATAIIDGFYITAGQADGTEPIDQKGGGMYNSGSDPTLVNITFSANSAFLGGGMYNHYSSPGLTNIVFSHNSVGSSISYSQGGGMYNYYSNPALTSVTFSDNATDSKDGNTSGGGMTNNRSSPTLSNVTFSNNSSCNGGGMSNGYSHPTLTDIIFTYNSATSGSGGGMSNSDSHPTLTRVTFSNNSATASGGGIRGFYSSPALTNVIFSSNSANNGGGMYWDQGAPSLTNVSFSDNTSTKYGGGISAGQGGGTFSNVSFTGNSATTRGGGMYVSYYNYAKLTNVTFYNNSSTDGGGMYNYEYARLTLTNVTFSGNSASGSGGGMYSTYQSDHTLTNAILWGNTAATTGTEQIYHHSDSTPTISYSDIQGSGGSSTWDTALGTDGGGNIDSAPLFVSAGNLRLQTSSPAIDAGNNDAVPIDTQDLDGDGDTVEPLPYDFDNQTRFWDMPATDTGSGTAPIVDMGAYETGYTLAISKTVDDDTPLPTQTITFTIVATNSELDTTSGLISDTLPSGLNFVGPITLQPSDAGTVGTALPTLASSLSISSGEEVTITFPVTVSLGLTAGTQLTNSVAITSNEVTTPVTAAVIVTVQNAPPAAVNDTGTGFISAEDTAFTTASVLSNDSDPNGDTFSMQSIDTGSTLGTVTNNNNGTFDYDPNGQFESLAVGEQATDTFTYTISDGQGGVDTATVTISITGVNDAPTADNDSGTGFNTDEDTIFTTASVLTNDSDPDSSDMLSEQSIDTSSTLGTVTNKNDGTFDYDPNGQFESLAVGEQATDTFTYTISDGQGGVDTATVTISITGVKEPFFWPIFLPAIIKQ